MRLLFIAPSVYPVRPDLRYGGVERLCYMAAVEVARRGHQVAVAAPEGSYLLHGIEHILTGPTGDFVQSERQALVRYRHRLREFDAILEYSHSHWSMLEGDLPAIAFIWHDPHMMKPQEPCYNIAALSLWQAQRFAAVYGYEARVLDPHCSPIRELQLRTDRFLVIGRLTPSKGPLEAVAICRELGVPLDVVGALGPGDDPQYQAAVEAAATNGVRYHGEVDEGTKMHLLETCRALLYAIAYPPGRGEASSHKCIDALCCGAPVITYDVGALSEVVEHGVTGFLAGDREEFKECMGAVDTLDPKVIREKAAARWSVEATADRLLQAAERVAEGQRWGRGAVALTMPAQGAGPKPNLAPAVVGFLRYTLAPLPRQVRLDTINACNASCNFCHLITVQKGTGRLMPQEVIEAALDDIATWPQPLAELVPVNFGELFLRRDWYDLLKAIEGRLPRTSIAFATNGSRLTPEVVRQLAQVRTVRWVNFSINGFFAETYEQVMGLSPKNLKQVWEAATLLKQLRPDIRLNASMVFDPTNMPEIERDLFVQRWSGLMPTTTNPANYAGVPGKEPTVPTKASCRSILDGLVLLRDGRVITGCCYDVNGELEVGRFPDQRLLDIWRGDKLAELSRAHNEGRRGELPLCSRCTFA